MGRRDGVRKDGENAWASIGRHKYQIEYPVWGLDSNEYGHKNLKYFFVYFEISSTTKSILASPVLNHWIAVTGNT